MRVASSKAFVRVALAPVVIGVGLVAGAMWFAAPTEAHKAITSKFNYNDHVFPVLRDRCAKCHVEGGPTPMSLMTYKDALPWAESIREQLVGEKMPPWYADASGPGVRGGHSLSTRELDILVTWAVGGTPEGALGVQLPAIPPPVDWRAGRPDLVIPMEREHTLAAGTMEEETEITLATGLKQAQWIKAVDLLPGTRSMVRDAQISLENGTVLAAWVPGYDAAAAPNGNGFKIPAGAKLRMKIHYKKHWQDEQNAKSDKSSIGLYFTDEPTSGRDIQSIAFDAPASAGGESLEPRKFGGSLKSASRVLAVRPSFDEAYASVDVHAVLPAGRRISLLRLRSAQPQWHQRYWLTDPIDLPAGAKVEITATPAPADEFGIPAPKRYPLRVALELVAQ